MFKKVHDYMKELEIPPFFQILLGVGFFGDFGVSMYMILFKGAEVFTYSPDKGISIDPKYAMLLVFLLVFGFFLLASFMGKKTVYRKVKK